MIKGVTVTVHWILYQTSILWAWYHMAVIPALRKLRQEDREFETCLGYRAKPCLKIKLFNSNQGLNFLF
jgi:hypothetical protein